jgi:NAD(P)-dependent dehydrogenase (short-subunit alcohol dehydrogenase family)
MVSQGSRAIVNTASMSGQCAGTGRRAYDKAKAGVIMPTRQMAISLVRYHNRVNAIAARPVDETQSPTSRTREQRVAYSPLILVNLYSLIHEIGRANVSLASDDAWFATGETISVDGGFLAGRALTQGNDVHNLRFSVRERNARCDVGDRYWTFQGVTEEMQS